MALSITRGRVPKAQKVVLYGPEGVGKTTFAAKFPDPLFIDTEGSTEHYDVARTEAPGSWPALMDQVRSVKAERPCSTLVVDTADWAERLCIEHVCAVKSWKSIEDAGYGKGYTFVVEEFCRLLDALSDVADAGINVVLTAHAAIRKFEQPDEAMSYNRWALALIDAAKMSNAAKVKEWADAVLFANYETIVETVGDGKGAKGKARGQKRVLHTQHNACWDAKNRWGLADKVPFDYGQIEAHVPLPKVAKPEPSQAATPIPMPASSAPEPVRSIVFDQDGSIASDTAKPNVGDLPGFWAPALQLMEAEGVTPDEIKAVAVDKGHFTRDTPLENYPHEYVDGVIVAQWDATLANVRRIRKKNEPVPFGAPDMTKA